MQIHSRPGAALIKPSHEKADYVPSEVIVKLRDGRSLTSLREEVPFEVIETFEFSRLTLQSEESTTLYRLRLPDDMTVPQAVAELQGEESVAFAEPNFRYELPRLAVTQTEPPAHGVDLHPDQWGLHNTGQTGGKPGADISALEAWKINSGGRQGEGPLIAVIDSGIDYDHPDLWANLWINPGEIPDDGIDNDNNGVVDDVHGYNAFDDNGDPMDRYGHGTHCAGILGAVGDNREGITGVSPKANMMAVKIFSDEGRSSTDVILRGLAYSAKMGARITSDSWGGRQDSQAVFEAFKAHPALHIVAAGNQGYNNDRFDQFPANFPLDNIVAMAATTHIDQKASFSQWGAKNVDLAAPGENILSTLPEGKYGFLSGTSMATPHVSGAVALLMNEYPEAGHEEIKRRLQYGSDRSPALLGISVSNGRLNAARSLENDTVAPGAPNDFKADNLSITGGEVSWTSVGDDKWSGGAAPLVELYRSDRPIDESRLAQAERQELDGAAEVGDLIRVAFRTAPSEVDTPIHFAMRSLDNVGHRSELRTTSAAIPAADVPHADNFDGPHDTLITGGTFARVEEPGRGLVYSASGSGKSTAITEPIDLTDRKNSHLKFDFLSQLGSSETAQVWASTDGETWKRESILTKTSGDWKTQLVNVSEHDGKIVRFKIQVEGRESSQPGTLKLDNLKVLTEPKKPER